MTTYAPTIAIREFRIEDIEPLTSILTAMLDKGSTYPGVANTFESLSDWLFYQQSERWVITVDEVPVGHLLITPACEHLYGHLSWCSSEPLYEIRRFFVSPDYRGLGLGALLLEQAIDHAKENGYMVTLTIPETCKDALNFCLHQGLLHGGSFVGHQRMNHVFWVEQN